jgi:U3 small nucleolar RNA-associated protein 12
VGYERSEDGRAAKGAPQYTATTHECARPCPAARGPFHLRPPPPRRPQEGTLEVFDIGACALVHVERAHAGAVWSLALLPDKSGFVSGSADKTVKFWTWAVQETGAEAGAGRKGKKGRKGGGGEGGTAGGGRHLAVAQTRELGMAEDVLCVRVSPDGRLMAVALLDATIKVYYLDRWGHNLGSGETITTGAAAAAGDGGPARVAGAASRQPCCCRAAA